MIRLRPRLAAGISIAVWALSAFLVIDALLALGPAALLYSAPVVWLSALCWAALWHPQVIIDENARTIIVRNVLHTYELPAASILDISISVMVKLTARLDASGRRRSIQAWNAPGISKMQLWSRPTLSAVTDPLSTTPSRQLLMAWERWGGAGRAEAAEGSPDGIARVRWNIGTIVLMLLVTALMVASFVGLRS